MIKRDLAEILQKEMRDPRLSLVTITSVEVARDFTLAKVFVSCMGTEGDKVLALRALHNASGFLRGRLGTMLSMRTIPTLAFRPDTGIEQGIRMFELLRGEEQFIKDNVQPEEVAAPDAVTAPVEVEEVPAHEAAHEAVA